jgi:hypothetical protein
MSTEFEIAGTKFRANKMAAWTQADVLKRMLPIFCSFIQLRHKLPEIFVQDSAGDGDQPKSDGHTFDDLASAVAMQIAKLEDRDSDFVYNSCLDLVYWQRDGQWVKIYVGQKRFISDEISGAKMLAIISAVLKSEFSDFFREAQGSLLGALLQ